MTLAGKVAFSSDILLALFVFCVLLSVSSCVPEKRAKSPWKYNADSRPGERESVCVWCCMGCIPNPNPNPCFLSRADAGGGGGVQRQESSQTNTPPHPYIHNSLWYVMCDLALHAPSPPRSSVVVAASRSARDERAWLLDPGPQPIFTSCSGAPGSPAVPPPSPRIKFLFLNMERRMPRYPSLLPYFLFRLLALGAAVLETPARCGTMAEVVEKER